MKILVFPHQLVVCGTVVNALDLAAALRDSHGHEVVVFATPGPMIDLVREKGLRLIEAPPSAIHPSLGRMRALRDVVRVERPDVIHAWDWSQCLDAFFVEHALLGVPLVATDMEMTVGGMMPRSVYATYGTPELVEEARRLGHRHVDLLLPPVDVHYNSPSAVDEAPFRRSLGLEPGELAAVTVSRLDRGIKADSLYRSIDAVRALGRHLRLRLVIVGDGNIRTDLDVAADKVNAELGRPAVVFTGAMIDPRPAYAAADIVIGMGGSALRAMAFRKPVVVVGEGGFAEILDQRSAPTFYYKGLYGLGDGRASNERLEGILRDLAEKPARLPSLASVSHDFVSRNFALEVVSEGLARWCHAAVNDPRRLGVSAVDGIRTAGVWLRQRRFMPPHWETRLTRRFAARPPA